MKIKSFALLLACILFTTILIFLYGDPQPSINEFVTQTQGRLSQWKNAKVTEGVVVDADPEEKYLKNLGFYNNPHLYPVHEWKNVPLPVFVTAISPSETNLVTGFVKSLQYYLPDYFLLIYELGLNPFDITVLNGICNSTSCSVRHFDFDLYPSHVQNLKLFAYRPLIIQEVLSQAGAVFWIDAEHVFISGDINNILNKAQKEGLVSWTINQPTSALTHPRMFDYFHTKQDKFFFHRMIQPSHIVLYNTGVIHQQLMLPWAKCALVLNCIAPIGAQSSGCRFDKKPLYRYSGCHRYDMSALNVVLGIMFDYTASRYVAKEEDKFFHHIEAEIKKTTLDVLKNSTIIFSDVTNTVN